MVARNPHRWRELIHQEVRRADGTATPLHRWVRRYRRPFDLTWPYGSAWERIRPFSTGGNYLNFQPAEDDATRTAALWEQLPAAPTGQAKYDPDNLFRVSRNGRGGFSLRPVRGARGGEV
jgi:hypothetical protein